MNIKVNNQYLDYNDTIDVDRMVKLFEEAGTTQGDVSYDFSIPATTKNKSIFELFTIDQSDKIIYSKIPATLESNGNIIYIGFIKVESENEQEIECTFFSGNSNWFNDLNFNLRDFDFSSLDVEWNVTSVAARETATTGAIFPIIDLGSLSERSYVNWHIDEIHPFVYVKSAIQTLLNRSGIKLTGDILNDWRYNHLITSNSDAAAPQEEVNDRSVFINKTNTQTVTGSADLITFNNETGDYYPGSLWDTTNDNLTADVKMTIEITMTIEMTVGAGNIGGVYINKNGSPFTAPGQWTVINSVSALETTQTIEVTLEEGDVIDFRGIVLISSFDVNSATLRITPIRLHKVFTSYLLPDKQAKDFVSGIFALFNPVINYNPYSKTLNVDLFKNVIRKTELDISQYIDVRTIENDYSELMLNYGESNVLSFSESDSDEIAKYNKATTIPYGAGEILSENELSQESVEILNSDFVAAIETVKNPFNTFLPKLSWRSLSEDDLSTEGVSLTSSSGLLFTASGYAVGDIVRVSNSTVEAYDGEWIVSSATSTTFKVAGLTYAGDATADVQKMNIEFEATSEQALLLVLPNLSVADFTHITLMFYADSSAVTGVASPATAYFYKPLQGLNIDDYKETLSFGTPELLNTHQITMIDSYWKDFEMIVKDPVKARATAHFPKPVFDKLFDGPLRLKTKKFNTKFFCNKVTGYEASHLPCEVELIKISAHSQSSTYTEGPAPDPGYGEDLQEVIDFATDEDITLPSDEMLDLLDVVLTDLRDLGALQQLDLLYIFSTDGDEDFATLNLVDPTTFKATMVNSVTWIPGSGFQGDGVDGYLNTGWDADTNAVHYTLNEGGAFVYSATDDGVPDGTADLFGSRKSSGSLGAIQLGPKNASSQHIFRLNSNSIGVVGSSVTAQGFFHIRRVSSNDVRLFKNGSQVGATDTSASNILNNADLYILATGQDGVAGNFSSETVGVFGIGASLAGLEQEINDIFNTFTEAVELLPAGAFLLEDDSGFITLENDTDLLIKET